ncbi:MAG: phenylalanine--tRNA ligase subunit beta [Candidatus Izemoplasmatales bacterium]|nr:phenylalanine--tRNA ligase subunit beta [Candidatus Izemoplasmatales bacterium]
MILSINWLRDYLDVTDDLASLRNRLNLHSAEVSRLEPLIKADHIIIGHVLNVVEHPNSDHLHLCQVDIGSSVLDIVCGASNVAKGQKVIVAQVGASLPGGIAIKEAKIRGVRSQGMIVSLDELGIEHKFHLEDGIHVLDANAPVGGNPLQYMHLDDYILELDLTPNRADLLSHIGVAYELGAVTDTHVKIPEVKIEKGDEPNPVSVFTETKGCRSYYLHVIRNVTIKESPMWLKARLLAVNIRPINNIVDITNYVLLEYGQPLHAFDYDKLKTNRIIVRQAAKGEKLMTLDGKERLLEADDIVITDGTRPIALAGVMGGADSEVDDHTQNILLEAAVFDPLSVRRTAKRLDLRSESSIRFERGVDPARTKEAAIKAIQMMIELAGGHPVRNFNFFDVHSLKPYKISLSLKHLAKVTGRIYSDEEVANVLHRLNFKYSESDGTFLVTIPTRRLDIRTDQDLIEEIVRIHGYDFISTTLPATLTRGGLSDTQKMIRRIRYTLTGFGFDETMTYSLVAEKEINLFCRTADTPIKVLNPISEERAHLRHSLLPSLIDVAIYNQARQRYDMALFELGRGYHPNNEVLFLSGLIRGKYRPSLWQKKAEEVDFYLLKGMIEALCDQLGIEDWAIRPADEAPSAFHPGLVAELCVQDAFAGYLGRLHPQIEQEKGLEDVFVFEIHVGLLLQHRKSYRYIPLSKYPAITRDLALIMDKEVLSGDVRACVLKAKMAQLVDVEIFDVYLGNSIPEGKKSMALNLVFQDQDKTLSTEEVDGMILKVLAQLLKDLGATLRVA